MAYDIVLFLELAGELRNLIYEHALSSEQGISARSKTNLDPKNYYEKAYHKRCPKAQRANKCLAVSLLRTNRQINKGATSFLYSNVITVLNIAHLTQFLWTSIHRILHVQRLRVEHVDIIWAAQFEQIYDLRSAEKLQELTFVLYNERSMGRIQKDPKGDAQRSASKFQGKTQFCIKRFPKTKGDDGYPLFEKMKIELAPKLLRVVGGETEEWQTEFFRFLRIFVNNLTLTSTLGASGWSLGDRIKDV